MDEQGEGLIMECEICGDALITGLNGDICIPCYETEQDKEKRESEEALYNLKHDLANSLQPLKKFDVGYTSKTNEAIAVEHNGRVFILRFEETPFTLEMVVGDL